MDNIELEIKIKQIIAIDNYFEMMIEVKNFEKDYKLSEFYKITKKSLSDVIKEARIHYALQLNDVGNKIQKFINELDLTKINELLNQVTDIFGKENADIAESLELFKNLKD